MKTGLARSGTRQPSKSVTLEAVDQAGIRHVRVASISWMKVP